jgi:hypothetical protein
VCINSTRTQRLYTRVATSHTPLLRQHAVTRNTLPKSLRTRIKAFTLLFSRKRHTAIPQAPSSPCIYSSRAQKFDEENAEYWKGGAEGILVFVRWLFNYQSSATVLTYSLFAFRPVFSHLPWPLTFPQAIRVYSKIPMPSPNPSLPKYHNSFLDPQMLPRATQFH